MSLSIGPLVSLIAGILILIMPRLLNYIVAIYLILMGLLGLFGPRFAGGPEGPARSAMTAAAAARLATDERCCGLYQPFARRSRHNCGS